MPALNLSNLLLLKYWGFWIQGGKDMNKEENISTLLVIIILLIVVILQLI